jgi:predicted DsbA family dithiol-disulfide isomerase
LNINTQWVSFSLQPDIPPGGRSLHEILTEKGADIEQVKTGLKKTADKNGLPFRAAEKVYNTRLAQEMTKLAEQEGKGDVFHDLVFKAYFSENADISDFSLLAGIAVSIGINIDEAIWKKEQKKYSQAVKKDWADSREMNILSVPTFIIGQNRLVGARPYEIMKTFLIENNATCLE